jgi:hypothetical protein
MNWRYTAASFGKVPSFTTQMGISFEQQEKWEEAIVTILAHTVRASWTMLAEHERIISAGGGNTGSLRSGWGERLGALGLVECCIPLACECSGCLGLARFPSAVAQGGQQGPRGWYKADKCAKTLVGRSLGPGWGVGWLPWGPRSGRCCIFM